MFSPLLLLPDEGCHSAPETCNLKNGLLKRIYSNQVVVSFFIIYLFSLFTCCRLNSVVYNDRYFLIDFLVMLVVMLLVVCNVVGLSFLLSLFIFLCLFVSSPIF